MRCFLAINLSDEIKDYLEDLILKIGKSTPYLRVKWVERENLHLTLGFIENIDESTLKKLSTDLDDLSLPENLILCLGELGLFPNDIKPRIVKISLHDTEKKLGLINDQIKQIFKQNNLPIDEKPFSPHITLGRIKTASAWVRLEKTEPRCFNVVSIDLMKSKLTPSGPTYSCLKRVALNA